MGWINVRKISRFRDGTAIPEATRIRAEEVNRLSPNKHGTEFSTGSTVLFLKNGEAHEVEGDINQIQQRIDEAATGPT